MRMRAVVVCERRGCGGCARPKGVGAERCCGHADGVCGEHQAAGEVSSEERRRVDGVGNLNTLG